MEHQWGCPECAFMNSAERMCCFNCEIAKPEGGDNAQLSKTAQGGANGNTRSQDLDEDLMAAIQASMQEQRDDCFDKDLEAAIQASLADGPSANPARPPLQCSLNLEKETQSKKASKSTECQSIVHVQAVPAAHEQLSGASGLVSRGPEVASSEDSCFRKLVVQVQIGEWRYENYFRLLEQVGKDAKNTYKLVNRLHTSKDGHGRTPLALAVLRNQERSVRCLIQLDADINMRMGPHTALTLAIQHEHMDCSDLVRVLLSLGADPAQANGVDKRFLNRAIRYWLQRAQTRRHFNSQVLQAFDLQGLNEIDFAVVGERVATTMAVQSILSHCGNRTHKDKPLCLLITGPPGHGKTYFTKNLAASIVGPDNFLFIPCGSIRSDRQLFGMSAGASFDDGLITAFLRERQHVRTVIMLDELEKIKDQVNELGWEQDKRIYKAFLEPWQEGSILAPGASDACSKNSADPGRRISCANCIFICTTNEGQEHILAFYAEHEQRLCDWSTDDSALRDEMTWIENKLVKLKLADCFKLFFKRIDKNLDALYRRFDKIIPFMPFKPEEAEVVADIELRNCFAPLQRPPKLDGDPAERRLAGNLRVVHDDSVSTLAARDYDKAQGASSMMKEAQQITSEIVAASAEVPPRFSNCPELQVVDVDGKTRVLRQIWITVETMADGAEPQMVIKEQEPPVQPEKELETLDAGRSGSVQSQLQAVAAAGEKAASDDDFEHLLDAL